MGTRILLAVVTSALLLPGAAWAQAFGATRYPRGHVDPPTTPRHAAPPPVVQGQGPGPNALSGPAGRMDLFLAGPDTYAPHYDRFENPRRGHRQFPHRGYNRYGHVGNAYSPLFSGSNYLPLWDVPNRGTDVEPQSYMRPRVEQRSTEALVDDRAALPPHVIASAAPKTFYVIPNCYAGDSLPRADQLPAGCDVAKARAIARP